jgi:hypothetical protein
MANEAGTEVSDVPRMRCGAVRAKVANRSDVHLAYGFFVMIGTLSATARINPIQGVRSLVLDHRVERPGCARWIKLETSPA